MRDDEVQGKKRNSSTCSSSPNVPAMVLGVYLKPLISSNPIMLPIKYTAVAGGAVKTGLHSNEDRDLFKEAIQYSTQHQISFQNTFLLIKPYGYTAL